jgi:hypothetical protein
MEVKDQTNIISWSLSYVHRPPTVKGIDYEKEIKRVATFGSVRSEEVDQEIC